MEEKYKICCMIGEQLDQFPWIHKGDPSNLYTFEYQSLLKRTLQKLIAEGYNYFICDGTNGANLDFAEEVLFLRDFEFPHIKLEVAIPCRNQDNTWNNSDKKRYQEIIELADEVLLISEEVTESCLRECNEYIINKSNIVLAFLNEKGNSQAHTFFAYAKQKNIKTILLNLCIFMSNVELSNALMDLELTEQRKKTPNKNISPEKTQEIEEKGYGEFLIFLEKAGKMQDRRKEKRIKRKL